jgi:hypothetical protein
LVVVEDENSVSALIAVNYACSVGADIKIVLDLPDKEARETTYLIQGWREGNDNDYLEIEEKVNQRIGDCAFNAYKTATFFTNGLPYSLIIKNIVRCCHVHLLFRPDFFVFNAIRAEHHKTYPVGLVFSPGDFLDDETDTVISILSKNQYYVRELLQKEATVHNLDFNVKELPYGLFHVCSHGGEVDGYAMKEEFTDRDGVKHTIEYDEVVGFAPAPGSDKVGVHRKTIFRKFDGISWGSKALKDPQYPHYVFVDMHNSMRKSFESKKPQKRTRKPNIPGSCAIKCHFSIYQAMFQTVASQTSPIVFNNSCWSWSGIADSFLVAGARGYIGTLWAVGNKIATDVAKEFYSTVFKSTISEALHAAAKLADGSNWADIYMFWGLPFSTLKNGIDVEQGKYLVFRKYYSSTLMWREKAKTAAPKSSAEIMTKLSQWNEQQIYRYFTPEEVKKLILRYSEK